MNKSVYLLGLSLVLAFSLSIKAEEVKWAFEETSKNGILDRAWMGNSKGGTVESPKKKGGLRGVTYSSDYFYEGNSSLKFTFTKKSANDWAFAAITCGNSKTGMEAKSWKEVDAGHDISKCSHFEFYIKGNGDGRIEIKDTADNGSFKVTISDYGTIEESNWNKISIPLKAFGLDQDLLDVRRIKNINVLAEQDCPAGKGEWTYYIDNMTFKPIGDAILKGASIPEYKGERVSPFTAEMWLTKIKDGKTKDKNLGKWNDEKVYDHTQDEDFSLLAKEKNITSSDKKKGSSYKLFIDTESPQQRVLGLGAAMTDSSAYVLYQLKEKNPTLYNYTMEKLFSPIKGAGFTVIRLPVGASDYTATKKYYTYCDEKSEDLSTFTIEHDKKYIIPVLKDALKINPKLWFMGSPWSAPAWMKTNNSLFGVKDKEKSEGVQNRLKPEYIGVYADYLIKFVKAYEKEGITVNALSLQNEPQFDGADYPCMRVTKEDYLKLLSALGPKLDEQKLSTGILLHDHNWVLHPNDTRIIGGDKKIDPLTLVTDLYKEKDLQKYIIGSAWHCYSGGLADVSRVYKNLRENYPDKYIMTTEITAWGKRKTDWSGDLDWSFRENWLPTFENGGSVSLQWNLVLDHKYGPSPRHDSEASGLATVFTDNYKEVKFEREFYAMAHFSKAVSGGATKLKTHFLRDGGYDYSCSTMAFKRDDGKVGVFILNKSAKSKVKLSVEYRGQFIPIEVPAKSIVTLLW